MCSVSMIYDHYKPKFPPEDWKLPTTIPPVPGAPVIINTSLAEQIKELADLIKEFKEAVKAAKIVDKALGAPDCADPEKAKLEERVAQLEKQIAALTEKKGVKRAR